MLSYNLDMRGEETLYTYLYICIKHDIENGTIAARSKLPSKRNLARHLGISVSTVEGAYSQLLAEGYIQSEERRGFFVCDLQQSIRGMTLLAQTGAENAAGGTRASEPLHVAGSLQGAEPACTAGRTYAAGGTCTAGRTYAAGGTRGAGCTNAAGGTRGAGCTNAAGNAQAAGSFHAAESSRAAARTNAVGEVFTSGITSAAFASSDSLFEESSSSWFPFSAWSRELRATLSQEPQSLLCSSSGVRGQERLRKAIAEHVYRERGMKVQSEQVVIGAGAQSLYGLLAQLLGNTHIYAIEDPAYMRLFRIYRAYGAQVVPVPLQREGISMDALVESGASVAHLMPSHQFPTGGSTTAARRYELLAWAAEAQDRFIIEDDYDCQFRLAGKPLPTLQSMDVFDKVIYTNTFTKSMGANLRLAYMILPAPLMERFQRELSFYSCSVGTIEQITLARFLESKAYERHVNRLRKNFRQLRDALLDRLQLGGLAGRCKYFNQDSGLSLLLSVSGIEDAETVCSLLSATGGENFSAQLKPLVHFACNTDIREKLRSCFFLDYSTLEFSKIKQFASAFEEACLSMM